MPHSYWNYRLFACAKGEETWVEIREVHYVDGTAKGYSATAATLSADDTDSLLWMLDKIREAATKPVLTEQDFGKPG